MLLSLGTVRDGKSMGDIAQPLWGVFATGRAVRQPRESPTGVLLRGPVL